MIRFLLGLVAAVLAVLFFVRFVGSLPSASDVIPAHPPAAVSSAETCQASGGQDLVRVLPDRTVEVVRCEVKP